MYYAIEISGIDDNSDTQHNNYTVNLISVLYTIQQLL